MAILAGFDVHRAQITFDALNTETGEVMRGRMRGDREAVGEWVAQFAGEHVEVALEACTGWLFVYEGLGAAGAVVHLAEPAETSALRGKKRHAKTDRARTRGGCGRCWWRAVCRRRGSRPRTCVSGGPRPGCARRSSMSAPVGCSASARRCLT